MRSATLIRRRKSNLQISAQFGVSSGCPSISADSATFFSRTSAQCLCVVRRLGIPAKLNARSGIGLKLFGFIAESVFTFILECWFIGASQGTKKPAAICGSTGEDVKSSESAQAAALLSLAQEAKKQGPHAGQPDESARQAGGEVDQRITLWRTVQCLRSASYTDFISNRAQPLIPLRQAKRCVFDATA
jgi:hypothetical protein